MILHVDATLMLCQPKVDLHQNWDADRVKIAELIGPTS